MPLRRKHPEFSLAAEHRSDFIFAISCGAMGATIGVDKNLAHLDIFSSVNLNHIRGGPSTCSERHAVVGLISEMMLCKRPKPEERLTWPQQKVKWCDFALAVFTTKRFPNKSKHTSSHLFAAVFGIANTRMVVTATMQAAWPPMPVQKPCRTKDRSIPMIFSASLRARSNRFPLHKPTQKNGHPWSSLVIHGHPPHQRSTSRIGCTDPSK